MNSRFKAWRHPLAWTLPSVAVLAGCTGGEDKQPKTHALATYSSATWEALPAVSDTDLVAGFGSWRSACTRLKADPVWGAWVSLQGVADAEFPKRYSALVSQPTSFADPLLRARLKAKAPTRLSELTATFAALLADRLGLPMIYVRKAPKGHGRNAQIEGHMPEGARVLVIEDLTTAGGSMFTFIEAIRAAGGEQVQLREYDALPHAPPADIHPGNW